MTGLRDVPGVHIHRAQVAGQAVAGTADEFHLIRVPYNATLVADAANFAQLTVRNRGVAAAGATKPASRSYAAVNSAAFVAEAMTLSPTAADLALVAGDVLTAEKLNTGTGVALPAGTIELHLQYR